MDHHPPKMLKILSGSKYSIDHKLAALKQGMKIFNFP